MEFKNKDLRRILIFAFCLSHLLFGCEQKSPVEQAQNYARQSHVYYQRAVAKYKDLIIKSKDQNRLYFELGQLHYQHGEFRRAIKALQKTKFGGARKFLAISYYRLSNFTEALEIFSQQEAGDDEYLYYYGLTCERLNLFDKALEIYQKVKTGEFALLALERINLIEKQAQPRHIQDVDPQVSKVLASVPGQEEYPQAGALILSCNEKIEITPEGRQLSSLHYLIKILNERGKEDFSETHIDYDSTYEKVELEFARVIKPDGRVVEVGSRHIRDVSKYLNFPLYSNVRVFIISFPEVAEDASIEYKLKIYRNQLVNKKDFMINYPLQSSEPIIAANFDIVLPKEKALYIKTLNEEYNNFGANLKPQIKEENDRLVYSWRFIDIPQIIPESNMPPQAEINPTLLISTFNNWQEIYNWWWNLAKDKIRVDAAIKDKVKELTDGLKPYEEKIKAIYNFCAQEIRYVAVEYGQAGYEPHSASDIFKNKYGDCKDQAILLVTMLKEAGFPAFPVLIATKEYYNLNEDFPAIFFNHCIAAIPIEGKVIFVDPTAETCSFGDLPAGDQERRVLIFKEDGYEIQDTPLYPASHNRIKQDLKIEIKEEEGLSAEKSIFTYGIYDQAQRAWLLYMPPELIAETLKEKIQEVSIGATLDKYTMKNLKNLNDAVELSYVFHGPEYLVVSGKLRIMPQLTALDTSLVAKDKRKYALDFNILDSKEAYLEIAIPDKFVVKYMPQSVSEDSPWLKFSAEYSYRDNKISFREKTELKKSRILENEYPEFKKFFTSLAKKVKQRVVLEKIR